MKYLPHIFLPPLLIALIAATIYLPKHYRFGSLFQAIAPIETPVPETAADFQTLIAPYLDALDTGNLDSAQAEITKLKPLITEAQMTGLLVAMLSAKKSAAAKKDFERALAEKAQIITTTEAKRKRLEKSVAEIQTKLNELKKEQAGEATQFRKTLATLTAATESANQRYEVAAAELLRLRQAIEGMDGSPTLFPNAALPSLEPLKIPAPMTVHFQSDSTRIPESVGVYVNQMGDWLNRDSRLGISLRGKTQKGFSPEKNEELNSERALNIKNTLISNGASEDQIEVAPLDFEKVTDPNLTEKVDKEEIPPDPFGFVELVFFRIE